MPPPIANPTDDRIRAKRFRFDKPSGTFREGKPVERFIAGPLPLWWVTASNALPGKAGAVGLALWFLRGVQTSSHVKLTKEVRLIAGCSRQTVYTALESLEGAGLIRTNKRAGSYPVVEIITTVAPTQPLTVL